MNFPPVIAVAHEAGPDGAHCVRCKTLIGAFQRLHDEQEKVGRKVWHPGELETRPWKPGELVFEYETVEGRSAFADTMTGPRVPCQPA